MTSTTRYSYSHESLFFPLFTFGKWNSTSKIPTWTIKWALFSERLSATVWWFRVLMCSQGHRKSQVFATYLIKGRVTARIVLINHEGWTIINDFKFFRNLSNKSNSFLEKQKNHKRERKIKYSKSWHAGELQKSTLIKIMAVDQTGKHYLPSINHLITFFHPTQSRHPSSWSCSIQVDNHIVFSYHQL